MGQLANKQQRQDDGNVSKCIKKKRYYGTRSQKGRGRERERERNGVEKEKMKGVKDSG